MSARNGSRLVAVAFLLAACTGPDPEPTALEAADLEGTWRLIGGSVEPIEGASIDIEFDAAGGFGAQVYCNAWTGSVDLGTGFSLDAEAGTEACTPVEDISAGAFAQTIKTADEASLVDDELIITGELGELRFLRLGSRLDD